MFHRIVSKKLSDIRTWDNRNFGDESELYFENLKYTTIKNNDCLKRFKLPQINKQQQS